MEEKQTQPQNIQTPPQPVVQDIFANTEEAVQDARFGAGQPYADAPAPTSATGDPYSSFVSSANQHGRRRMPWQMIVGVLGAGLCVAGIVGGVVWWINRPTQSQENTQPSVLNINVVQPIQTQKPVNTNMQAVTPIDTDGDGLSDADEAQYKTDLRLVDSDQDGLTDREEIKVYGTNPLDSDTDDDRYLDGEEVKKMYNPKGKGKLFDIKEEIEKAEQAN